MRRLFWQISLTADGFVEDRNRDLTHTAQIIDADFERYASAMLASIDGFVVGRRTYELFAAYWPHATGADADRLNGMRKLVASRSLRELTWHNAHLAGDDIVAAVRAWKREPGRDLAVFGSPDLAATLVRHDLVDEFRFLVTPFLLGNGTPLWRGVDAPVPLRVVRSETWASGTVATTYRRG